MFDSVSGGAGILTHMRRTLGIRSWAHRHPFQAMFTLLAAWTVVIVALTATYVWQSNRERIAETEKLVTQVQSTNRAQARAIGLLCHNAFVFAEVLDRAVFLLRQEESTPGRALTIDVFLGYRSELEDNADCERQQKGAGG